MILNNCEISFSQIDKRVLAILLFDQTTEKNILWGTNDYLEFGSSFSASDEIRIEQITGIRDRIIQPRVYKTKNRMKDRTLGMAEVFTPSWVCNLQNNLIDEQWFENKNVFNFTSGSKWKTNYDPIRFPDTRNKTWEKYIDEKRLEMTCGEAPYLVSRYDTVTGAMIPVKDRIGLLDRKLRVVGENAKSKSEWLRWARRAIESIYGYEYQGDNLLLARVNVLFSFAEYYEDKFDEIPDVKCIKDIARVISWNLWQMDGFNYAVPYFESEKQPQQMSLFDFLQADDVVDYTILADTKGQALCKVHDWRSKETLLYKQVVGGEI